MVTCDTITDGPLTRSRNSHTPDWVSPPSSRPRSLTNHLWTICRRVSYLMSTRTQCLVRQCLSRRTSPNVEGGSDQEMSWGTLCVWVWETVGWDPSPCSLVCENWRHGRESPSCPYSTTGRTIRDSIFRLENFNRESVNSNNLPPVKSLSIDCYKTRTVSD